MAVAVVNPTYVRRFAQGMGTLAKTDPIDARMIAWYASVKQPKPRPPRSEAAEALSACVDRRDQLVAMRTMEKNRLGSAAAYVQSSITAHIESIDEQIKQMEVEIDHLIDQEEEWQSRIACMTSCKGSEGHRCDLAGGDAGTGTRETRTNCCFGRGSSYEQGQRQEVRQAEDTRRQEQIAACLIHGGYVGSKIQSCYSCFLPAFD